MPVSDLLTLLLTLIAWRSVFFHFDTVFSLTGLVGPAFGCVPEF